MHFDDKIPIYYQIKNHIYHEIITGTLQPGEKLPSVRQLAVDVTANVNTVQRALSEMIAAGIIESKRGRGNFVTMETTKITDLKTQLVTTQLAHVYQQLHALNLSDEEILTSVQHYIERKGQAK